MLAHCGWIRAAGGGSNCDFFRLHDLVVFYFLFLFVKQNIFIQFVHDFPLLRPGGHHRAVVLLLVTMSAVLNGISRATMRHRQLLVRRVQLSLTVWGDPSYWSTSRAGFQRERNRNQSRPFYSQLYAVFSSFPSFPATEEVYDAFSCSLIPAYYTRYHLWGRV